MIYAYIGRVESRIEAARTIVAALIPAIASLRDSAARVAERGSRRGWRAAVLTSSSRPRR